MSKDLRDLSGLGGSTLDSNSLAEAFGFLGWTTDPLGGFSSSVDSTGSIHGGAVWFPAGVNITTLSNGVTVAGVAVTHGIMGIFDANFNLLGQTADSPASYQGTGWVDLPLTTPYKTTYDGIYYLADLLAATTTMPTILNAGTLSTGNFRATLPNGRWRYFNQTGPFTAFPTTLTPATSGLARILLAR